MTFKQHDSQWLSDQISNKKPLTVLQRAFRRQETYQQLRTELCEERLPVTQRSFKNQDAAYSDDFRYLHAKGKHLNNYECWFTEHDSQWLSMIHGAVRTLLAILPPLPPPPRPWPAGSVGEPPGRDLGWVSVSITPPEAPTPSYQALSYYKHPATHSTSSRHNTRTPTAPTHSAADMFTYKHPRTHSTPYQVSSHTLSPPIHISAGSNTSLAPQDTPHQ